MKQYSNKLAQFQHDHGLVPDGIMGPITLKKGREIFNIKSDEATAHFFGQLAHETNNFKSSVESLNYSVTGLQRTFLFYRKNPSLARKHGRSGARKADQQAIANNVYNDANRGKRYKLGNTQPGDGWRFRGRGSIMITGRNNYEAFFTWMGLPKDTNPDLVATKYYWEAALWFFEVNRIWWHTGNVTERSIVTVTKLINGGVNGLNHRRSLTLKYYRYL